MFYFLSGAVAYTFTAFYFLLLSEGKETNNSRWILWSILWFISPLKKYIKWSK